MNEQLEFPDKEYAYRQALIECCLRYRNMIADRSHWDGWVKWNDLYDFVVELENGAITGLPLMKLNRWLGYIQGVLIERGLTDVTTERNWTRPLSRPLDFSS